MNSSTVFLGSNGTGYQFITTTVNSITTIHHQSAENVIDVVVKAVLLGLIFITAVFLNTMVSLTLHKKTHLMTTGNRYVFSLTVPNCIFSILVLPFIFVSVINGEWIFGVVWCNFTGFITIAVLSGSMIMLAVIALDRYYAVVRPMLYPLAVTNIRSVPIIVCTWLIAIICSLPPSFGWSNYKFHPAKSSCLPLWNQHISYTVFLFVVCYLTPFIIMAVCYTHILNVARTKARRVNIGNMILTNSPRRHSSGDPLENRRISFGAETDSLSEKQTKKCNRRDSDSSVIGAATGGNRAHRRSRSSFSINLKVSSPTKALRTIFLIHGVNFLTLAPMLICASFESICGNDRIPDWVLLTVTWLALSSTACYPCIYGLWNKTLRKEVYNILCNKSATLDEEEMLFLQSRRASWKSHSIGESLTELTKMQLALIQFRANRSNSLTSGAISNDSGTVLTCIDETDVDEGTITEQDDNKETVVEKMSVTGDDSQNKTVVDVHTNSINDAQSEMEKEEKIKGTLKESSDEGVQSLDDETDREQCEPVQQNDDQSTTLCDTTNPSVETGST
ncbi:G-protein coupled receptor 161-like [Saccoglossus kowalevskii]|uniref:G-protein coupled receptor 161-like n=1 Tax=Saccoglossus kowalevskii TaxID=10224 RepID=A0ABM0GK93_SACKO|nr:PREDICTED: G-protein coupled receptor 161-like [Saccoglossus kowalevskii]